jgi:hypothetical protein
VPNALLYATIDDVIEALGVPDRHQARVAPANLMQDALNPAVVVPVVQPVEHAKVDVRIDVLASADAWAG